ncbi:hypothetical protein CRYUN_Cryun15aG0093900 [Craigia yunnanensis]
MSVSIEALAMAEVDYMEWSMDIEEWERHDEVTPPHLLADDEEEEFMKGQFEQSCSRITKFKKNGANHDKAVDDFMDGKKSEQ